MDDAEFAALGAQYREAMGAIIVHRCRQAEAEVAYGALYQQLLRQFGPFESWPPEARDQLDAAKAPVDKTVADVEWCKACTVAAGEAFKGETFATAVARNAAPQPIIEWSLTSFGEVDT